MEQAGGRRARQHGEDFFLNLSLNKKLVLMMLLMTAVLLVTLITIYWQAERNLMAQIESQTAELAQAVQVGVEEVTGGASSETRLEQYLSSLKTKGIKEISIISNADEIIASTNPNKIGTPVSQKKKELIIKAELGEPAVDQEGKAYNVIIPVIAGQAHYGYIHLQINVENLQETLRRQHDEAHPRRPVGLRHRHSPLHVPLRVVHGTHPQRRCRGPQGGGGRSRPEPPGGPEGRDRGPDPELQLHDPAAPGAAQARGASP
jgi:hypothetical protein